MDTYSVARLDEIEEIDDGRAVFRAVRHHFRIKTFGINAMTARAAGDIVVNEHDEADADAGDELYVVISGAANFVIDGESVDAPAGTFINVPAAIKRSATAAEDDTVVLAIGAGQEGKPYEASGWELFAPLFPLFKSGDYRLGADRAEALLADGTVQGAGAYYNTACFESLAGRTELALEHLGQSLELAPSFRTMASEDEDLAALRDDPRFQKLVADPDGA